MCGVSDDKVKRANMPLPFWWKPLSGNCWQEILEAFYRTFCGYDEIIIPLDKCLFRLRKPRPLGVVRVLWLYLKTR